MYALIKRFFDILLALFIIVVLSPVFGVLFILLRFTGEGYIFYYQKRIGYLNKPFNIIKFATMLKNSPNMGTGLITLRKDPRVTPMGGFLRMTKLNELPQIFNVLKGDAYFLKLAWGSVLNSVFINCDREKTIFQAVRKSMRKSVVND